MSAIRLPLIVSGVIIILVSIGFFLARRGRWLSRLTVAVGLFLVAIGLIMPNLPGQFANRRPDPKQSASSAKNTEQTTSSHPARHRTPGLPTDSKTLAAVNMTLADQLKLFQGQSRGTLDASGHAFQTGTPNHSYDWSLYLKSVTLTREQEIVAQADNFKVSALVAESRKELAGHAQEMALAVLAKQKRLTNHIRDRGIYVALYTDKTIVAHSQTADYKQFEVAK